MPANENLGYGERPVVFRTTIALPFELFGFIQTRAKRFPRVSGRPNVSAYFLSLLREDQARFVKNGAGKRGAK